MTSISYEINILVICSVAADLPLQYVPPSKLIQAFTCSAYYSIVNPQIALLLLRKIALGFKKCPARLIIKK